MEPHLRRRAIAFGAAVDRTRRRGALALMSSETGFVAETADLRALAELCARACVEIGSDDVERVLDASFDGATVREALSSLNRQCGETCRLDGLDVLEVSAGCVAFALTPRADVASLVALEIPPPAARADDECERFAHVLTELEHSARERGQPGLIALSLQTWVLDALARAFAPQTRTARCLVFAG